MIFVLSGPVHSGKTTLLKNAAALWMKEGFCVGGFLSEAQQKDGNVIGYNLIDLKSGASVVFLRAEGGSGWPRSGAFFFRPQGLETAGAIMLRDQGGDVLIVDEVGPLELRTEGLWPTLEKVILRGSRCLCVVREDLIEKFRAMPSIKAIKIFHVKNPVAVESMTKEIFRLRIRLGESPAESAEMNIEIRFFAHFRELFDSSLKRITLPRDGNLGSLLTVLCDTPKRRAEIFDGATVRPHIIIMKNGAPVDSRRELQIPIEDGDRIAVFPFVGGG